MALLEPSDVLIFVDESEEVVEAVVEGLEARAVVEVPELANEDEMTEAQAKAVKSILVQAAMRFIETGGGTIIAQSAPGGYTQTLASNARKDLLYPSEIKALKKVMGAEVTRQNQKAFVFGDPNFSGPGTPGNPEDDSTTIGDVEGLQAALDAKVDGNDPRLTDSRTPKAHSHGQGDITGLTAALSGKANVVHNHDDRYYTQTEIDNLLDDYGVLPIAIENITGLQDELDAKVDENDPRLSDSRLPLAHNHDGRYYTKTEIDDLIEDIEVGGGASEIEDINGLEAALDGKANVLHNHNSLYYTKSETYTKTEVENLIDDLEIGGGSSETDGAFKGEWTAGTYKKGDSVTRWGRLWGCTASTTTEAPVAVGGPSDAFTTMRVDQWEKIAVAGTHGDKVIVNKGAKNSDFGYVLGDQIIAPDATEYSVTFNYAFSESTNGAICFGLFIDGINHVNAAKPVYAEVQINTVVYGWGDTNNKNFIGVRLTPNEYMAFVLNESWPSGASCPGMINTDDLWDFNTITLKYKKTSSTSIEVTCLGVTYEFTGLKSTFDLGTVRPFASAVAGAQLRLQGHSVFTSPDEIFETDESYSADWQELTR